MKLETKIEVLQSGNLPDDQKASLNGLTERTAVAPRLFCDICDCFDLHDTEECPRQTSGDSPPPTQYHADRHAVRKYCDSCEVFGHEEGECPLDETY
ncbi:CAP-Gly domain-containing linker protein 1 [Armadillidium vulgare]|nr:CAP-Gly domain-containing linker protein 1 [Armadillidium vulgare]